MTNLSAPQLEPLSMSRTVLVRGLWFMALWLVLMQSVKPADLAVGLLATIVATALSVHLLPPSAGRVRFGALVGFLPHFLWQSLVAGLDVARRALSPSMPLNPGFLLCHVSFPRGVARNEFAAITSLLPGSVPAGEAGDAIVYHCLDMTQPIAEQIAEEERRLSAALISGEHNG